MVNALEGLSSYFLGRILLKKHSIFAEICDKFAEEIVYSRPLE